MKQKQDGINEMKLEMREQGDEQEMNSMKDEDAEGGRRGEAEGGD